MTPDTVVQAIRDVLLTCFWLAAPLLIVAFIAGVVVSLVQIVTSIQDSAFNAVPRLAAMLVAMILALPWLLHKAMSYTVSILGNLNKYGQ
jgi:flagellar biosynthetic protein FliQ